MTADIIQEAHTYNWCNRRDLAIKFHWKDIAKDIGISPQNMSRVITGKGFPSKETMDKLIKYLDLVS